MFFKTFEFEFETRRLMWYCPYGGSDFAEVQSTTEKIKEKNYDSWYIEWYKLGNRLVTKKFNSSISKGKAYLRASRYFQAAEFFLSPKDSRKLDCYQLSIDYFYKGLNLLSIPYELKEVPFEDYSLRTLFFKTNQTPKGTLFICGGFDALLEELYFTNVKASLEEGYHVILFEGPGQSRAIRTYQKSFTPRWDLVVEAIFHSYQEEIVLPKIGIGLSLGGLLIARTSALNEHLFDKVVLYNYFPNMLDSFKTNIPKILHPYLNSQFPPFLEKMIEVYISHVPFLNWQIEHAKWVFGCNSLNQLITRCRDFSELPVKNPVLICVAKNDNYYPSDLATQYFKQLDITNKKMKIFDKEQDYSNLHCQNGAAFDTNDVIFDWLLEG